MGVEVQGINIVVVARRRYITSAQCGDVFSVTLCIRSCVPYLSVYIHTYRLVALLALCSCAGGVMLEIIIMLAIVSKTIPLVVVVIAQHYARACGVVLVTSCALWPCCRFYYSLQVYIPFLNIIFVTDGLR